jgi:HEAT repeat protein
MSTYDEAIQMLQSPSSWVKAAATLVQLGDRRAILPLLSAYELPAEGVNKLCLAEALRALASDDAIRLLAVSRKAAERRAAVRLMRLFAHESHLDHLERAIADLNVEVRNEARRAIAAQPQSESWELAVTRMLNATDVETRAQAIECLGTRGSATAMESLRAHGARETSPALRMRLGRALGGSR